uniref:uracil phosphoribosyltransferase n=2 Tax=Aegilops tauschii subsp. strangulata TaxID=200361 RepID=A0A452Z8V8_AEGTS
TVSHRRTHHCAHFRPHPSALRTALAMPSPATATAAAAGAPLHRRPCAPRRLVQASSCSLASRALVEPARHAAPAPLLVRRPRPSLAVARAASPDAATGSSRSPASGGQMLVFVPPHPLIKHWVSVLRNEQTPCAVFRSAMAELGRLLIYEACRDWLPTITGEIQTPVAVSSVEFIDPREPVMVSLFLSTRYCIWFVVYMSIFTLFISVYNRLFQF